MIETSKEYLFSGKELPVAIKGVNSGRLSNWSPAGKYNLAYNNCVTQASRALNASGAFNIGVHPYLLHGQMYLRSVFETPGFTSNANIYSLKYLLYWAYSILV